MRFERMRMPRCAQFGQPPGGRIMRAHDLVHPQPAEDAVMRFLARIAEQAEEHEQVAGTDAAFLQMPLRRAALAEQTGTILAEHGIVMGQRLRIQPAPAGQHHLFGKTEVGIGNTGAPCTRRDRQAYRLAVDDR